MGANRCRLPVSVFWTRCFLQKRIRGKPEISFWCSAARMGFRYRGRLALKLYEAGRAPLILISGGTRDPALPTEASLFRRLLEHGVPDDATLTEDMSRTTPENVANRPLCSGAGLAGRP